MNRGRMFVITLRKGGVGKTTVAMNLAIYLRQQGRNVAYLDLDPQRDSTSATEALAACEALHRRAK